MPTSEHSCSPAQPRKRPVKMGRLDAHGRSNRRQGDRCASPSRSGACLAFSSLCPRSDKLAQSIGAPMLFSFGLSGTSSSLLGCQQPSRLRCTPPCSGLSRSNLLRVDATRHSVHGEFGIHLPFEHVVSDTRQFARIDILECICLGGIGFEVINLHRVPIKAVDEFPPALTYARSPYMESSF